MDLIKNCLPSDFDLYSELQNQELQYAPPKIIPILSNSVIDAEKKLDVNIDWFYL